VGLALATESTTLTELRTIVHNGMDDGDVKKYTCNSIDGTRKRNGRSNMGQVNKEETEPPAVL